MKFLADENIPRLVVEKLREEGFDVRWVRSDYPGISDREVLQLAQSDKRIILTFDKDFGELTFKSPAQGLPGVILFRLGVLPPQQLTETIFAALNSQPSFEGFFTVVEEERIRMIPLPNKK